MKKSDNVKIKSKSVVLMVISALLLITATVCWFTMSNMTGIDEFPLLVDSPSSHNVFYEAVDLNHNRKIDGQEKYEIITTDTYSIYTSKMVPRQIYFYKVVIDCPKNGMGFSFVFNNIFDRDNYSEKVLYTAKLVKDSAALPVSESQGTLSDIITEDSNARVLSCEGLDMGKYELYYTLELDESAESEYQDKFLSIGDIDLIFYEDSVEG